jgi:hypothetical protein
MNFPGVAEGVDNLFEKVDVLETRGRDGVEENYDEGGEG